MKLNTKRVVFVGFAFFLISTFWQAYDTIIPKILTDKFGLSQTISGIIMALDNVLALFLLPLFGAISDKCKSRHGRRTPFIFVGTLIAVAAFICLSFVDNMQLTNIEAVVPVTSSEPAAALEMLYDEDLTILTPDGDEVRIQDKFSKEEFASIRMKNEDGTAVAAYNDYVVPARQTYAWQRTLQNPTALILFVVVLLVTLLAMATFRSPAVALMPDVTIKPLRSKANAIINLMGTAGGIVVLVMGTVMSTGSASNALMSYIPYFIIVGIVMLAALVIFRWKVNEPLFVAEMEEESRRFGIDESEDEDDAGAGKKLSKAELRSLLLILSSVVLWFMGYNAIASKYSIYASSVLGLSYSTTLLIANVSAVIAYVPVGMVASKIGRKKTILAGIVMLATAFLLAAFQRAGSPALLMTALFALAGIGWATINVNSFPMVVELSKAGDVGRYTGFYYTASMAAQTLTPILSGFLMDKLGMTILFPYGFIFVVLAFFTMLGVKHGDNKPAPKGALEALGEVDD